MRRRLVILQPDGNLLYPEASRALMRGEASPPLGEAAMIDLSDIPNANSQAVFVVAVEELCDHERWHEIGRVPLPCWNDNVRLT